MINNVNLYQNIQLPKKSVFKAKQETSSVTSPVENIALKGTDALASYNSMMINRPDKFDIPLLKPLKMPKDINSIDGERVYNSKGILQCVIKETKDKKYVYEINDSEISEIAVYDNKTGNKVFEQSEYSYKDDNNTEHIGCWIHEFDPITGWEKINAKYEDGKPILKSLYFNNKDGSFEAKSYSFKDNEYVLYGYNAHYLSGYDITYDSDKNLKYVMLKETKDDGTISKDIKYEKGQKVSQEIHKSKAIQNSELQKYIHNPELKPAECPGFITSIENLEGEKTYYSNGMLESVKTPDGKVYGISLNGNCITLYDKNKSIEFTNIKENKNKFCTITEDLGNASKKTSYSGENGNELYSVSYTKNNIEKFLSFENSKPNYYSESKLEKDTWKNIFNIEYAPNGGVLNVYRNSDV